MLRKRAFGNASNPERSLLGQVIYTANEVSAWIMGWVGSNHPLASTQPGAVVLNHARRFVSGMNTTCARSTTLVNTKANSDRIRCAFCVLMFGMVHYQCR